MGAVSDDELRRRMDRLATGAPDPSDERDRVLERARRRARLGGLVAGIVAVMIAGVTVMAVGTVANRRPEIRVVESPVPTGTVTPGRTDEPTPPADPEGAIAFWSDSAAGGSARLMLIDADGTGRSDVAGIAISTSRVSWSPDGRKAVFDHGTGEGQGQLDVMDTRTGEIDPIFQVGAPQSPDWSPDGERIVFHTDSAALFTIPAGGASEGQPVREYGPNEFLLGLYPTWSPDGDEIAFVEPSTGSLAIVAVNGAGPPRTLPSPGAISSLDWGPQGLIVSGSSGADSSLFLMDPDGVGPTVPLTDRPGDEIQPSISPDGRSVAYVGNAGGRSDLYVMRTSDGRVTQITNDARQDLSPVWRPVS